MEMKPFTPDMFVDELGCSVSADMAAEIANNRLKSFRFEADDFSWDGKGSGMILISWRDAADYANRKLGLSDPSGGGSPNVPMNPPRIKTDSTLGKS